MSDAVATSFATLNYSGLLFNKGNTDTPFTTLIGGKRKTTDHVEFITGQEYNSDGTPSQPSISETASLTAPDATLVTRSQKTNVTQIFMGAVAISYAKQSNMGTLAGINIKGQTANPMNELDFQVGVKMQQIAQDIEYTLLNGTYNKATSDATVNKTRGMFEAVTTNVVDCNNKDIKWEHITEALRKVHESNAPTDNLVLIVDADTLIALNAEARTNNMTVYPASRTENGIALDTILTPFGKVGLMLGKYMPSRKALLVNPSVCAIVEQPTPNKGNFFMEELAKTGAGTKYQIFGQLGLDHGPEWYHCVIKNIGAAPASGGGGNQGGGEQQGG